MQSRKGMVTSQIFLYVFGLVAVILVISLGYKGIKAFSSSAEASTLRTLESKMTTELDSLSTHKGEVKELSYIAPSNYDNFCFFDIHKDITPQLAIFDIYPQIKGGILDKSENFVLIGTKGYTGFRIDSLRVKDYPYFYCSNIKGNLIDFNAAGGVIDGELYAVMLVSNKVETNVSRYSRLLSVNPNKYKLNDSLIIYSADKTLSIELQKDTQITLPGTNDSIAIQIVGPTNPQRAYNITPIGINFAIHKATVKLKTLDCAKPGYNPLKVGNNDINGVCDNGYSTFEINGIN